MPLKVGVVQTGLEASIEAAAKKAGRNLKINMGGNAKSIEGLSQPLGRITGKADQFTKSMEAANARVLAFGASVGILSSVTRGFQDLIRVTIDVEKSLTSINSILNVTAKELDSFKSTIFSVAKNTEQSFSVVAEAALELSRQGLKAAEVTKRLNDSLILSRLSGLGASEAVAGLTAAINSFNQSGITSAEVLNKLSAAAVSAAVSERDLIEGIKRSGSVATQAGVSFDELVGVITAVQAKTARGGAVIGNSFKTIFTRIQSIDKLQTMQNLGVEVTDASGQVLGATKLIQNLAKSLEEVPDARRLQIAEGLVGKFQVAPFLAILDDYISKTSKAISVTEVSQNATSEAYDRNEAQNVTLSAAINKTTVSVAQLAEALGKIGVTDNLKSLLGFFSTVVDEIQEILDGDGVGSKFAKGIVAGIGNIITGPAFAVFAAIIGKLVIDLVRFGAGSLKTFFGLNKAAKEQATLQGQIASTLLGNSNIQKKILSIENSTLSVEQKRVAQTAFFTTALNEQVAIMTRMQGIAAKIAPGVMAGTRGKGRAAGGFIPNYNAIVGYGSERADISKGVGGAPSSARPVTIPNFNFGGGQKGTMVANSSEYIVPNYAGGDGSAIFNQDMAASIGLPPRARKIGAAGGYIPNFANEEESLVMFAGDRGADEKKVFHVGKDKAKRTKAYASKPKGMLTTPVTVPIYRLKAGKGDAEPQDIKVIRDKLSKSSTNTAKNFAKNLSGKTNLPNVTEKKIESLFNPGAFEGMSGSIFEVALGSILASKQFLDYSSRTSNSRIDLPYDNRLFSKFGARGKGKRGSEVKATGSLASGAAEKFYDILVGLQQVAGYKGNTFLGKMMKKSRFDQLYPQGIGPRGLKYKAVQTALGGTVTRGGINNLRSSFAGGYIPNFAGGLQDAIGREKAAGLPINQIRVNQDPKLRNSGNPMGLAVTNTRDEPTGAIPNFAKKGSTEGASSAMGDFTTKLFGVQIGLSALGGLLGEVTEKNKLVSGSLTLLNVAITAAMASSAFGGLKGIGSVLGGSKGRAMQFGGRKANLRLAGTAGNILPKTLNSLKILGGGLLRLAGPVGIATGVFMGVTAAWNSLSGANRALESNTKNLASAAAAAAKELEEIDVDNKDDFERNNAGLVQMIKAQIEAVGFEGGKDDDQLKQIVGLVEASFSAGGTFKQVQGIVQKAIDDSEGRSIGSESSFDEDAITSDASEKMGKALKAIATTDFSDLQKKLFEGISREDRLTLSRGANPLSEGSKSRAYLDAIPKFPLDQLDIVAAEEIDKKAAEEVKAKIIARSLQGDNPMASDLSSAVIKKAAGAGDVIQKDIEQISGREGRARISTEIELLKLRAQALTADEKLLASGRRNKSLSELQIVLLQNKINLAKENISINSSIADALNEEVKNNESITLSVEQVNSLTKELSETQLSVLADDEMRKEILKEILNTMQKTAGEEEALSKFIEINILGIRREGDQKKRNIGFTQEQLKLDAQRAAIIANITRDLTRQGRSRDIQTNFETGSRKNALQLQRGLSDANPNLTDAEKARRNVAFTAAEGVLDIDESKANAVKDTRTELTNLIDKIPDLGKNLKVLIGVLDKEGFGSLDRVSKVLSFVKDSGLIKLSPEQEDALANTNVGIEGQKKNVELTGQQADVNNALSEAALKNINAFKAYSVLLSEFTLSLNQSAEQLKLDFLMVKDGASAISNIDQQLFTAAAKVGGAGATARASDNQALRGATDQITLARTSVDRRAAIKNKDILAEELAIKTEVAEKQKDGVEDTQELVALREKLVALEKQRLAIGTSRAELFENEFVFTQEEIQEGLDRALVQNARTFVDTIRDGLVDAISKSQDLGDALKQAGANFFNQQANANLDAAFKNISSSGFVQNIASAFSGNPNAKGGAVTGGSGSKDDVPALLMGGEFVMRKSAVQKYGSGFMNSLNSGTIPAMARGGLFTPGTFGQGEMKGTQNLLDFATQSFTSDKFDKARGGSGFASVNLAPQSASLTMFGRRNSPAFQREQASKQKAFGLFTRAVEQERAEKERGSGFSEILKKSLLSFGASFAFKELTNLFGNKSPTADITQDFSDPTQYDNGYAFTATGGPIPYAAGVDTIPSMLSGGEFVMNAAATQRIGRGNLNALNSGGGGGSGDVVSKLDELISVSDNSGETVINITVNSDGSSNSEGGGDDQQNSLAMKIKDVVKQVIDDEKRLGGSLRQARA